MFNMEPEKERLRAALSAASKRIHVTDIAKAIGLKTPQPLYDFVSRGVLGPEKRSSLEPWLREHGFIMKIMPPAEISDSTSDPLRVARLDANALAAALNLPDREFSLDRKIEKLGTFVTCYATAMDRAEMPFKTGKK